MAWLAMMIKDIDLNLLTYLDVLLDEMNISRAALKLRITQPALSNALARLRLMLDDEILVRAGRQMIPTPFARNIRIALKQSLAQIHQEVLAKKRFDPDRDSF